MEIESFYFTAFLVVAVIVFLVIFFHYVPFFLWLSAKVSGVNISLLQLFLMRIRNVPPYIIAGGKPIAYGGPNNTMMTAYGIDEKIQKHIANAYRLVFHGQNSVFDAVIQINAQVPDGPQIRNIVNFINATKAGIIGKMK